MLNEHEANPGAAIGSSDIKLLESDDVAVVLLLCKGIVAVTELVDCHFFEEVNFGLPRFLCLISIHVSHLPNVVHLLQGRDTI